MSDQAVEAFASVDQTLAAVEEHLKVFSESSMESFLRELSPIEKAKVQVSLAYSINALLYVYLKSQGVSSKDIRQTHVKQELDRVKAFVKKIKDAEELAKGPSMTLDKEASKRFVNNALSRDQVYSDALDARKKEDAGRQQDEATLASTGSVKNTTPSKQARRAPAGKSSDKKSKRRRQ